MDFTIYWFMFPVSILISVIAAMSGIGGTALAMPMFLLIFPLLGPEYELSGPAAAVGLALIIQTFAFLSSFIGYYRKGLIDFQAARPFIVVAVSLAVAGALMGQLADATLLKALYGALMLPLAWVMIRRHAPDGAVHTAGGPEGKEMRSLTAADGKIYTYPPPRQGKGAMATGAGAFMTGMLSVGIGEVVMPQLVKRSGMPIPVAAATSVCVVIFVAVAAAITQVGGLIIAGGLLAVPWNILVYALPAVIIGGQIGPRLQGRISQRPMELAIGILFAVIAAAMFAVVWQA